MSACTEWKGKILEFVVKEKYAETDTTSDAERIANAGRLELHLKGCAECAALFADLRARAERVDAALPMLADAAELREGFEARVLARIADQEMASRRVWWSGWGMRLATAGVVCGVVVGAVTWPQIKKLWQVRPAPEVSITTWRSPTESLLRTPGRELLERGPKVGDVYLPLDTGGRQRVNK
jgi:hypothetical protein